MIAEGIGPKQPAPITMRLTSGDLRVLHVIAKERAEYRGYARKSSTWSRGLTGELNLDEVGCVSRAVVPVLGGAAGEYMAARYLGCQNDWRLQSRGDGGVDLVAGHLTIQVKTCQKPAGANLVKIRCERGRRLPLSAMAYVFAYWNKSRVVELRGWTWQRDIADLPEVRSHLGSWCNIDVSPLTLLPMCRLLDAIQARRAAGNGAD